MKEPRVNQSSVRYSDNVKDIINSCPGETFADRFEYSVFNFIECKKINEEELESLDKEIKKRKKDLDKIISDIYKYREISYKIKSLYESL